MALDGLFHRDQEPLRAAPQIEMECDIHKLMNKGVYGKTCKNQRKRTDIRLLTAHEKIWKWVSKPQRLNLGALDRNLLGVEMRKLKQLIRVPSCLGFAVLELRKLQLMMGVHPSSFSCYSVCFLSHFVQGQQLYDDNVETL